MTLRSIPAREPEPWTERQCVHEKCTYWAGNARKKGAKRGQKRPICPVLRFYGGFHTDFHGFLPACSATFSHIAIQTLCLSPCRPTNLWACRQTFQSPPYSLVPIPCSLAGRLVH